MIPRLEKWKADGKKIYIYSSGSVPAQKLIVGYSDKGDLRHFFSGYFDTSVGLKIESTSYKNIAKEIKKEDSPNSILFVTDNIKGTIIVIVM